MDKKLHETTNLGVKITSGKRQVKRKLGHVVKIHVFSFDVNVMFNLSLDSTGSVTEGCREVHDLTLKK